MLVKYHTRHKYFEYLIDYYDGRFAKDLRFRLFAMNTILCYDAISKSKCMKIVERQKVYNTTIMPDDLN